MATATRDDRENPLPGTSLALLTIPFAFSQDGLLTTGEFIKQAKERGSKIDLDLLQRFHETGVLVPLYRVGDTSVAADRMDIEGYDGANARGWVLRAATEGRVHDPAYEDYSVDWRYHLPVDERPDRWWNGFVYSSWQLLDLQHAINTHRAITAGLLAEADLATRVVDRARIRALAALATPYLPRVLGRLRFPAGASERELREFRSEVNTQELLRLADPHTVGDWGFRHVIRRRSIATPLAVRHSRSVRRQSPPRVGAPEVGSKLALPG